MYPSRLITLCFILLSFRLDAQLQLIEPDGLPKTEKVNTLSIDDYGKLVLIYRPDKIYCFDGSNAYPCKPDYKNKYKVDPSNPKIKQFTKENPNFKISCSAYFQQEFWIGTENGGLFVLDSNNTIIKRYKTPKDLADRAITDLQVDPWGQIWILTQRGLIYKYKNKIITNCIETHFGDITSILEDEANNLWILTKSKGVFSMSMQGLFKEIQYLDPGESPQPLGIAQDNNGAIWFIDQNKGLYRYDSGGVTLVDLPRLQFGQKIQYRELIIDSGDKMWIATNQGIYLLQIDDKVVHYLRSFDVQNGLPENDIVDISPGKNKLWLVGRNTGIAWIDFDRYEISLLEHTKFGLSKSLKLLASRDNGDLAILDSLGAIYYLSLNGKLDKLTSFSTADKRQYYDISFGPQGYILALAKGSLTKCDPKSGECTVYLLNDKHLKNKDLKLHTSNLHHKISSSNGLCTFDNALPDYRAPTIELVDYRLNFHSIKDSQGRIDTKVVEFKAQENNIGFEFKGIHLAHADAIRYIYRLVGANDKWSEPGKNTQLLFSQLDPGTYVFEVKAIHGLAPHLQSTVLSRSFKIAAPIWTRWWAKLVAVFIMISLFFFWYRNRLNALKKKINAEQEALQLKNRLLDLERKALQLQMNPHFIFNALNSVKKYIRKQEIDRSEKILTRFASLMRDTLEQARRKSISLEEEIDLLEHYIAIEQSIAERSFKSTIDYDPEDLDVMIPPMMIQSFVENAIVHGIRKMEKTKEAWLKISFKSIGKTLEVRIANSGPEYLAGSSSSAHQSLAIKVTKERLSLLPITIKPNPHIRNLFDSNGKHYGVEVTIRLPDLSEQSVAN